MQTTFEAMGGTYRQEGDYLLPNIETPEIRDGFKELDELLGALPLDDNNAVFNLCCSLCTAYERKSFIDGLQYGARYVSHHEAGNDLFGGRGVKV